MNLPRREEQRGQVLPLFVLIIVVLLGFAGMVLDAGMAWTQQRRAQNAADAAAYAAAYAVRGMTCDATGQATAVSAGQAIASANGFAGATVNFPPAGTFDCSRVEVITSGTVSRSLSQLLFSGPWVATARAVAWVTSSSGAPASGPAFFQIKTSCGSRDFWESSSNITVNGDVYDNGDFSWSGLGTVVTGSLYYNDATGCTNYAAGKPTVNGSINTNAPWSPPFTVAKSTLCPSTIPTSGSGTWAKGYYITGNTSFPNGPWWQGGLASSGQLNPGIYCITGGATMSSGSISGNVTIVADNVQWSGCCYHLTAYDSSGILFYATATGDNAIQLSGSGGDFSGILYAPNGEVHLSGNGASHFGGSLVGYTIHLSGSDWTFSYKSFSTAPAVYSIQLVE